MELVDINKIKQQCMIDLDSLHTAKEEGWLSEHGKGRMEALEGIMDFIENVQPTKEVDLDESARHYLLHEHISPLNEVLHQVDLKVEMQYHKDIEDAYKAGFELGLKSKKGE